MSWQLGLEQGFSTGALGPIWVPRSNSLGTMSRGLYRIARLWYCNTQNKARYIHWWPWAHKCWESLEGENKPWKLEEPLCSWRSNTQFHKICCRKCSWHSKLTCVLAPQLAGMHWHAISTKESVFNSSRTQRKDTTKIVCCTIKQFQLPLRAIVILQ